MFIAGALVWIHGRSLQWMAWGSRRRASVIVLCDVVHYCRCLHGEMYTKHAVLSVMVECMAVLAIRISCRGAQFSFNILPHVFGFLLPLRETGAALERAEFRVRHFGTVVTFVVGKRTDSELCDVLACASASAKCVVCAYFQGNRPFCTLIGVTIRRAPRAGFAQPLAQRATRGFPDLIRFCYHIFEFRH